MFKLTTRTARLRAAALLAAACAATAAVAGGPGTPAVAAAARPGASPATPEQVLLQRLKTLYPGTTFSSVGRTPLPGVFEVVMGANVAYVGEDGRYFLFGHLFDLQHSRDLTAARQAEAEPAAGATMARIEPGMPAVPPQRIDVAGLPLRDAIVQSNGTGARKLYVFFDPHCPQCKRLDADLPQLADTTVYTFLVPLMGWESREAAQRQWVVNMPERALDTQVIDQNLRLARRLGIRSTPTMVRADGQVVEGAMSLPELMAWLDGDTRVASEAVRPLP
jgi:thiol:disulfide interchange protein DsbC